MDDCIHVISAADETFGMPLAVTVRSALDSLAANGRLHWWIVDGGLSSGTRERLLRTWDDTRLEITWLQPDLTQLNGLPVSGHINRMTYVRMLLPFLLPACLGRVLYLDADLLVRRDLGELWHEPLAGAACLGCVEIACPCMDAQVALANFSRCHQYLVAAQPVPNYRSLGLEPAAPYFNAGVLLVDLDFWRRNDLSCQFLACLRNNADWLQFWDQYALNVVLAGKWRPIDGRWNQSEHVYHFPSATRSPLDAATFRQLREDPWIVHFTSQRKPWHFESQHPLRQQFWRVVDRTAWRGWRPQAPYHNLAEWLGYVYQRFRQARRESRYHRRQRNTFRTMAANTAGSPS
jgi:lipopolysaccharide biosynthesis glycosyltransferase